MPENLSTILESTEPTLLTTDWGRTEGPLWHAEGYVTFVDLAGSRLLRWDLNGQVTVVREQTGEGNGAPSIARGICSCVKGRITGALPAWMCRHRDDHCRALARQTVQ